MFKSTLHKHKTQALEQSHKPTTTINHSFLFWDDTNQTQNAPNPQVVDVEWDNICKHPVLQFYLLSTSTSVSLRWV